MSAAHRDGVTARPEADFELIAGWIPQIVWMAAPDGSIEYFNQRGTDYTGPAPDANCGRDWGRWLAPGDADGAAQAWRDAVAREAPFATELWLRRSDGEFRWHACSAQPVRNSDGAVVRWVGTLIDIEKQHLAERRTAESLSVLETLLSTAPVGFGFMDRDCRLVRVNEALAATTGISIAQQLGW